MVAAGLVNLIPRWKGDKVEALRVTGESGKNMDSWVFSAQPPSQRQIKIIIGLLVEVGVIIAMGTHVCEFGVSYFFSFLGAPSA